MMCQTLVAMKCELCWPICSVCLFDAEKGLIFNVLRIASNCLNAEMHALIK